MMIKFNGEDNGKRLSIAKRSTNVIKEIVIAGILVAVVICSGASTIGLNDQPTTRVTNVRLYSQTAEINDKIATRGWFAEKIADMLEQDYNQKAIITFKDVDYNGENSKAINVAVNNGIMGGYADGTFRANDCVTFEEAIVTFCRRYNILPVASTTENPTKASDWAKGYVAAVLKLGLISDIPFEGMQDITSKDVVNFMGENFLAYYKENMSEQLRER